MSNHSPDPNASSLDDGAFPATDHEAGLTGGGFTDSGVDAAAAVGKPPSKPADKKGIVKIVAFTALIGVVMVVGMLAWKAYTKAPPPPLPITAPLAPTTPSPLAPTSSNAGADVPAAEVGTSTAAPLPEVAQSPAPMMPLSADPLAAPTAAAAPSLSPGVAPASGAPSPSSDPLAALAAGAAPAQIPAAALPTPALPTPVQPPASVATVPLVQLEKPRLPNATSDDAVVLRQVIREEIAPLTRRIAALEQGRSGTAPPKAPPARSASRPTVTPVKAAPTRVNHIEVLSRPSAPDPVVNRMPVNVQPKETLPPACDVQGVVSGRAWVKGADGVFAAYAVQDAWIDGTRITAIEPKVGIKGAGRLLCTLGSN